MTTKVRFGPQAVFRTVYATISVNLVEAFDRPCAALALVYNGDHAQRTLSHFIVKLHYQCSPKADVVVIGGAAS